MTGTGSQFDSVMLDMPVEDAALVAEALRHRADSVYPGPDQRATVNTLRTLASYIEVQINAAKNLAEKRDASSRYMGFDRPNEETFQPHDQSPEAAAAWQEQLK